MPLQPGTRLGPYEITAQIGVGSASVSWALVQSSFPNRLHRQSPGVDRQYTERVDESVSEDRRP